MQIEKVFEGGVLEAGETYNFSKTIDKNGGGTIFVSTGLGNFGVKAVWSHFPAATLGENVTFTDFYNSNSYYQVNAMISATGITINEIQRGSNWANSNLFMRVYKQG